MGISTSLLGPTLPGLAEQTRSSLSAISILFTARSLGSLAGSVGFGHIYDVIPGHRVMAFTILGMAVLTALTPLPSLLWVLSVILFLTGMVQGVLNIGGNALLVWVHERNVGPFMNGLHFCFGVGTFLTPIVIAQLIVQQGGLLWTYLLMAAIILPSAAVMLLPSPPSPANALSAQAEKNDPVLIVLLALVFGCYTGASLAYGGWIFTYAIKMNLANEVQASYLTSLYWGALTIGRLAAIPIAVRFKPQTILRADYLGALLSLLAILIWPASLAAVMVTSAGLGFALASIYPTTMTLTGQMMKVSGKVTGLLSIGSSAGAMLIPWIIGQFFESAGPQIMTSVLIIDMLLALVVLLALSRKKVYQAVQQP